MRVPNILAIWAGGQCGSMQVGAWVKVRRSVFVELVDLRLLAKG